MNIFNEIGCFGGGGKPPAAQPTPAPDPAPTPIAPSEVESIATSEERRQKLAKMRQGLASTIKTSAQGVAGAGSDLLQQTIMGKDKLGA